MEPIEFINSYFKDDKITTSTVYGGMMNRSIKVNSTSGSFICYFPTEQANALVDRHLEKECQSIFYDLGITSKNIYFDTSTGIKINKYIEGESLNNINSYDLDKVAILMHRLHDSNLKCSQDYNPFDRLEKYEKKALSYNKDLSNSYYQLHSFLMEYKEFVQSFDKCLCHNDSQKSNIIKDDKGNYLFIDFEFSANNDPIYDIAAFGNGTVEEGYLLLKAYEKNLTITTIKRFYLWRIFISLQWYLVAIDKYYSGEGAIHNFNFMDVADFFISNGINAYNELNKVISNG